MASCSLGKMDLESTSNTISLMDGILRPTIREGSTRVFNIRVNIFYLMKSYDIVSMCIPRWSDICHRGIYINLYFLPLLNKLFNNNYAVTVHVIS